MKYYKLAWLIGTLGTIICLYLGYHCFYFWHLIVGILTGFMISGYVLVINESILDLGINTRYGSMYHLQIAITLLFTLAVVLFCIGCMTQSLIDSGFFTKQYFCF